VAKSSADGLLWWDEVPPQLQFNKYIASGYRANIGYGRCLCSLFQLHNETGAPKSLKPVFAAAPARTSCTTWTTWAALHPEGISSGACEAACGQSGTGLGLCVKAYTGSRENCTLEKYPGLLVRENRLFVSSSYNTYKQQFDPP
jgi:hypothetical protein